MKAVLITLLLLSASMPSKGQGGANDSLADVILGMCAEDQRLRRSLGKEFQGGQAKRDSIIVQLSELGNQHNEALDNLISSFGFPGKSLVGMKATHAFWILVMHQDDDIALQRSVLEWMSQVRSEGEVLDLDFAFLSDRVAINEGRCQVYGTQVDFDKESMKYVPFEICDKRGLRNRRKRIGLKPFRKQMREENEL